MTAPGVNSLLALLPAEEFDRLTRDATRVESDLSDVVYDAGGPLDAVYFPRAGVLSVLTVRSDGATCEIGVVGSEGFSHVVAAFGGVRSPHRVICQVDAAVDRVPVEAFHAELARNGVLRRVVDASSQFSYVQVAQTTACNRHNAVLARCARWLLLTHDRARRDQFPMTHEFLSSMLGIRRPSVTIASRGCRRRA